MAWRSVFGHLAASRRLLLPYTVHGGGAVGSGSGGVGGQIGGVNTILARAYLPKHVRPTLATLSRRRRSPHRLAVDQRRSSYLEWNYTAELFAFVARIGETVDEELLRISFTDESYLHRDESPGEAEQTRGLITELAGEEGMSELSPDYNGHLAEAGRELVSKYTCGWLRAALPLMPEEGIQSVARHLTSKKRLIQLAESLGMRDLILTSHYSPKPLAFYRAVLAFIGAVANSALSSAESSETPTHRAERLVRDLVVAPICEFSDLHQVWPIRNAETVLSDVLQRCGRPVPEPRLLRTSAPTHPLLAAFQVGFYVDSGSSTDGGPRLLGSAPGSSVDEARWLAARVSLDSLMQIDRLPLNIRHDLTPNYTPSCSLDEWRPLLQ